MSSSLSKKQEAFLDEGHHFEFLMLVGDKFVMPEKGVCVTGLIISGYIKQNEFIEVIKQDGSRLALRATALEKDDHIIEFASKGDWIGILFRAWHEGIIDIGDLLYKTLES